MTDVTWYFDFISPYSYLGLHSLQELPAGTRLRLQPALLAGLLQHFGQKGPAEIATKRLWTYRSCIWLAKQRGVPFRMPAAHPFNPLNYLRLSIAAGNTLAAVSAIFSALWTTGADAADPKILSGLAESLGVDPSRLADEEVKRELRESTQRAADAGVFGVPSFCIDGQVFWGADSQPFVKGYLADPNLLSEAEFQRAASLPIGVARKL
jgi:2-hydroxychromene-2-carboxylate isomerase